MAEEFDPFANQPIVDTSSEKKPEEPVKEQPVVATPQSNPHRWNHEHHPPVMTNEPVNITQPIKEEPVVEPPHIELPEEPKPVQQEIKEELTPEQRDAMTRNSIANTVKIVLGSDEELTKAVETSFNKDERVESEKIEHPSSYLIDAYRAQTYGFATKNQRMQARLIKNLENNNVNLSQASKELRIGRLSASSILKNTNGTVSGQLGSMAVIAATQGLYKIRLYNSGFSITIRPITMEMADEFIQSVDREFEELGRILGGFYHLPVGVMLKQKIADFLPQLIINSNLIGWKDTEILLDAISYNDYDTILWALSTIIYKDGIGIGLICTNPDCLDDTSEKFIDLSKVCYLNLSKLNPEAITWMLDSTTKRSPEDIRHYKEDILGNKREFTPKGTDLTYIFKEPSMNRFIGHGLDIIGKLSASINGKFKKIEDTDSDEVKAEKEEENLRIKQKQFGMQLYRMLIPWISELRIKDGNKYVSVTGYDAIAASLEMRVNSGDNLYNELENFIRDSRCAYFCADHLECPKCHKKIGFTKNELVPIDIEYVFFFLSCLMLEQAGLEA